MKKFCFRAISLLLFLTVLLFALTGCRNEEPERQVRSYYTFFDTKTLVFSYLGESEEDFKANCDAVEKLLEKWHKMLDIYYEYSGMNNLRTLNKNAGKGSVELAPELIDFLLYAKEIYALTGGKTNVAFGAVTALWHEEREIASSDPTAAKLPSEEQLKEAKLHTDINSLVIDKENCTAEITDPKMKLDVGAIGKGYAAEAAAELLRERGVTSYVLNVGGNIICIGEKPNGDGWVTGITNPDKTSEDYAAKITLKDVVCVTSGDYERYYTVEGKNYHHIIDPLTLFPAKYFSSVTVLCKNSALADALSTALFCMSYEDGLDLVNSLDGVDVLWIKTDGTQYKTDGFDR